MTRVRLWAVALVAGSLAVAFGIRAFTGTFVESSGALEQVSGTALYASAVYGTARFLWPRGPVGAVAAIALGFCWAVEVFQLTPVPARLSDHSVVARLVLGRAFDPADLFWYVPGVAIAAALDRWFDPRGNRR
ncbi:DUF2809 domain-containing protein [Actinoplanes sp. CA-030573]|uniref:ribosomal maturation YjgA family protein n=1 Tax=Actinoplanes sp. CA-030573 TaxID=3239898 RepID=UPI003D93F041